MTKALLTYVIHFLVIGLTTFPFWLCWTHFEIGQRYFPFLPIVYRQISFWHCVGIFTVLDILKSLVPTLVSITRFENKEK